MSSFARRARLFLIALTLSGGVTVTSRAHADAGNMFDHQEGAEQAVEYSAQSQAYALRNESFSFKRLDADFILTAQITEPAQRALAGIRVVSAAHEYRLAMDASGVISLRFKKSADTRETVKPLSAAPSLEAPTVLQVAREGNKLIVSYARWGDIFTSTSVTLDDADEMSVGIFSQAPANAAATRFTNVRLVVPAWEGLVPYKDYIGSRLEWLDVATGERRIVYSTSAGIEAPNWTPDGNRLIYNSCGRLFSFDLQKALVSPLDTGFAVNNNNDHVLSFDGKTLGISNHSANDEGKSIIYKIPVTGGVPEQLTHQGPSYLHGWSPDGNYIVYTAERNGQFDIYRTTTNGEGKETQLTHTEGLDDAPEYSPDGKHIFFNSTRSGPMQIWRMEADGANPTQLTKDKFNNWFPHVSPDGKTLVFMSYLPDVDADQHPYYQQVYLRSMPVSGGVPKVIAYLYGGQGTINVPSWSPDSKRVAFVSNSQLNE